MTDLFWYHSPDKCCSFTRLYPIAPCGIGTEMVESLTSYVARLAIAHQVPTGVLLGTKVAFHLQKQEHLSAPRSSHSFFRVFFSHTGAWNGTGVMADNLVQILTQLTELSNLERLTLLAWREVLPSRKLLRPQKAWCPICFEEWNEKGIEIYEPLIWSFTLSEICPIHNFPLQHICPYCHKHLFCIEWNSRPGFCSHCHQWLGQSKVNYSLSFNEKTCLLDKNEWQKFTMINIGWMLATNRSSFEPPSRQALTATLNYLIEESTGKKASAFASLLFISKTVPLDWQKGNAIPQLYLLLRLCYIFQISLPDLLSSNVKLSHPLILADLPNSQQIKKIYRPLNRSQVRQALETALSEEVPRSMRQVANSLKYDPGDLTKYFPELCRAISERYRSCKISPLKKLPISTKK